MFNMEFKYNDGALTMEVRIAKSSRCSVFVYNTKDGESMEVFSVIGVTCAVAYRVIRIACDCFGVESLSADFEKCVTAAETFK